MRRLEHPDVMEWRRLLGGMLARGEIVGYYGVRWEGGQVYYTFIPCLPVAFARNTVLLSVKAERA